MTNLPSTARQSTELSRPATTTREDDTRLLAMTARLEKAPDGRWQIPGSKALSSDERGWLLDRREALQRSLLRASERLIAAEVIGMFLRFTSSANASDTAARDRVYVEDLRQFPLWAVQAAIGKVKGPFAPSSPVLVDMVRACLDDTTGQLRKIHNLLSADVYRDPTADERAKVDQAFRDLVDNLRLNEPVDVRPNREKPPTRAQAEEWLADLAGGKIEPPALSAAALRTVGLA